jgi:hypothetical protein
MVSIEAVILFSWFPKLHAMQKEIYNIKLSDESL